MYYSVQSKMYDLRKDDLPAAFGCSLEKIEQGKSPMATSTGTWAGTAYQAACVCPNVVPGSTTLGSKVTSNPADDNLPQAINVSETNYMIKWPMRDSPTSIYLLVSMQSYLTCLICIIL